MTPPFDLDATHGTPLSRCADYAHWRANRVIVSHTDPELEPVVPIADEEENECQR